MLKYSSELSEEFRRGSSLSSLQVYHKSKSESKNFKNPPYLGNYSTETASRNSSQSHAKYEGQGKYYQRPDQNMIQRLSYNDHQNYENQQKFQHELSFPSNKVCHNHCLNINSQAPKRTMDNFHCTPLRKVVEGPVRNYPSTATTCSSFLRTENNRHFPYMTEKHKNSLCNLHQNQIYIKTENNFKSREGEYGSQGDWRKCRDGKLKENKDLYSTKMRMNSVNNLENIQKKIDATLGQCRNFNI